MREIDEFKQTVLDEYPRYGLNDKMKFACHRGVPCFNECCRDITIFLTPYDILRMKNNLGISSTEFLAKYTVLPFTKEQRLPVVVLKMLDDEEKRCPFVREEGCSIYIDRPWACRMYPLGLASPKESGVCDEEFYFLMKEPICKGFDEGEECTIAEWIESQGIAEYNRMGEDFKGLTLHDYFQHGGNLSPEKMDMFYMANYDLDRFRKFVFESTFLNRFDIASETVERIKQDDIELMKFGVRWLRFCLFGEDLLTVKEEEERRFKEGSKKDTQQAAGSSQ